MDPRRPAAQPLLEHCASGSVSFSPLWGYPSPLVESPQQAATSLHSPPSTTLGFTPSPPNSIQHHVTPASVMDPQTSAPIPVASSSRSGKKQNYTPRPPNAFMLFRSWLIRSGKLPPEVTKHQQNLSKIAGKAWGLLDQPNKDEWNRKARQRLQEHEGKNSDHKFDPSPKNSRTGLQKIRKAMNDSEGGSDIHTQDHRATGTRRPRRGRTTPYKFPVTECTPQEGQAPQLTSGAQSGSPSMLSLTNFASPSPPPAQSLSPLSLGSHPGPSAQGIPPQPLPYIFLPPGLPDHFEPYQKEDGTIVFSDNYAPINPFSPPLGYYTGMFPRTNASRTMAVPSLNTAATILGLYELSPLHDHFIPNLSGGGTVANPPLSSLTAHEQEVFDAALNISQVPFTLEDPIPSPPFTL